MLQPDAQPILPEGKPRILFCGSTTLDTIYRVDRLLVGPGKVLPKEMAIVAHGMAASAATAAARLGAQAMLFSRLGDDDTGQRICDGLSAEGVDCSGVRRLPGITSSLCTVIVDDSGERLMVPYYDPALPSNPGWLPLDLVTNADAVLADVRWPEVAAVVLDAARGAGKPAVLDPRDVLLDLTRRASHAVFSEAGARIASGKDDARVALEWLSGEVQGFVAVTLGAQGCHWLERGHIHHAPGHKVHAVDTLAAGDMFHGVLTWALAQGVTLDDCIAFANAAAAIECQTFGGRRGVPERAELSAFGRKPLHEHRRPAPHCDRSRDRTDPDGRRFRPCGRRCDR